MTRHFILGAAVVLSIVGRIDAARFVPLGTLTGGTVSRAVDVSADGTIVIGSADYSSDTITGAPSTFRWTQSTGMTFLVEPTNLGGLVLQHPRAISGDGNVVVGSFGVGKPFKWSQAGGVVPIAPRLSPVTAASYDGSVIVGGTTTDISWDGTVTVGFDQSEAYRAKNGVRTWLGDLPGGQFASEAFAVSPDGTFVVGSSTTVINSGGMPREVTVPMRWTEADGMVALTPDLAGQAFDVSESKLVIVGNGETTPGADGEPFRWSPSKGVESIRQLLLGEGIDVVATGWNLSTPVAVSANGRIIVGTGQNAGNERAWLVELDIPGDFDADGDSDGNDFLNWQRGVGTTHDAEDLADWRANIEFTVSLQRSATAAVSTIVPEPSSWQLFIGFASIICLIPSLARHTGNRRALAEGVNFTAPAYRPR